MWDGSSDVGDANMKTSFKRFKYFLGLGFASLLILSSLTTVLPTARVAAQGDAPPSTPAPTRNPPAAGQPGNQQAAWIDTHTITYAGLTFTGPDGPTPEGYYRYTANGRNSCGEGKQTMIEFSGNPTALGGDATKGFLDSYSLGLNGQCIQNEKDTPLTLKNPANARLSTAQARCSTGRADQREQCIQNEVIKICGTNTAAPEVQQCIAQQNAVPAGGSAKIAPVVGEGAVPDPELECGVSWNPLTWMLCPFVHMINAALVQLDTAITNLLSVEQNKIFSLTNADGTDNPTGQGYYLAWKSFRAIALGILIIGALVMIVGQALGFEVLDPYTVKKILPRLIVAIIGIALSWDLMKFFVGFTNDLGEGVRSMIYFPFKGMGNVEVLSGGGANILTLLLSGGLLAFGIAGLLSFGLTALLGIFIAFMVLVLRQLVIIVLILFAPIAIACYILPNTQGIWKLWYESFTKALMMFPIIMAFLAVGRVMALTSSGPDASSIGKVVALIAYVLPYFLIPLTFRFAGGALRTLGGFVNDQGRGGFDRLKKYRGNTIARRGHEWKAGSLYENRGPGKLVNNLGRRAAVGTKGRLGFGRAGRKALGTMDQARVQETLKNNSMLTELANQDDSNAVLGLSGGSKAGGRDALVDLKRGWMSKADQSWSGAKSTYKQAQDDFTNGTINQAQMDAASKDYNDAYLDYKKEEQAVNVRADNAFAGAVGVGFNRQNATAALQTVAQNKSRAIAPGDFATVEAGIKRLHPGNDAAVQDAAYSYEFFSRKSGRGDLGGDFMNPKFKAEGANLAAGTGISQDEAVKQLVTLDGMGRTEIPDMLRGHSGQMNQGATTIKNLMRYGNQDQRRLAAVRALELQKNINYGSGDNQKIINQLMGDLGVDYGSNESLDDQIARLSGSGVSGLALSREARVYDQQTAMGNQQVQGGITPP